MFHYQGKLRFAEQKTKSQMDLWDYHYDLLENSSDPASCWIISNYTSNRFAGSLLQQYCRTGKLTAKQWKAAGKAAS